jgi:subtilisin
MRQSSILCFIIILLSVFTRCKKTDVKSSENTETCVTTRGVNSGTIIEGEYIVSYKNFDNIQSTSTLRVAQVSKDVLADAKISLTALRASFAGDIRGFVAHFSPAEAARLRANSLIHSVEPDRMIAMGTCFTVVAPTLITWNVAKVGYGDGTGKTAWILDTGIDFDHPDLNVDVARSKTFVDGTTSADDENGHGTHVAGIIGGKNNTIGVLGVASGANLVSLKVLDKNGEGRVSSTIQALSYISANAKAGDVVNMSFGEEGISDVLDRQVQAIAAKGIFVAIAAGNENKAASFTSPARVNANNVYTVSAVDSLNNFASFSNYGNDVVDFAAPGVRVVSTYMGGVYAKMSGTSQAAPHVAGLLLLNGNNLHYSATALNDPDGTADKVVVK